MAKTPGITTRHSRSCRSRGGGSCNCEPTYEAWVWSKRDGKKIRESFPTQAAAKGWRVDAMKGVRDKKLRAPTTKTLSVEVAEWFEGAKAGEIRNKREQPYKPNVLRNYRIALDKRVLPQLGDRRLGDIDLADLMELKEQLQGSGVADGTIRNTFVPLQAIYRRARRNGTVATNPTLDLGLPTSGSRDRAATPQEALAVLAPLAQPERGMWATAFYAGLRRGELRALKVQHVDLKAGTITVQDSWDDIEGRIDPKSRAGVRTVFALKALRPYLEPLTKGRPKDAFVFGSDMSPFEPRNVARRADRAHGGKDGKVPYTLHEARHSFSTWMDHAGITETRADRYMGHASAGVAGRYRHALATQLPEDARQLDAWLAGTASGKIVPLAAAS